MIEVKEARKLLGMVSDSMTDAEIEKLLNNLYSLVSQIVDNNFENIRLC